MEFQDTPEEAAFRAEARAFLEAHAPAKGSAEDFSNGYQDGMSDAEFTKRCKEWQATLAEHGWAGITWPKEYGGRGGTGLQASIFAEEQSHFGVTNSTFAVGIGMAGPTIIVHGTDAQKERFLPSLLRGEEVWCQLFSEPGAGSDLAGLSSRAVRDGEEWVVNGQKVWTSGAVGSDLGILLARTDPEQPKHRGITYFLCDMDDPGFEIRPIKQINGQAHFNEVFMTDVRVPDDRVLGGPNAGWGVAMTTLANERLLIGEGQNGLKFDDLLALATKEERLEDPVIRQGLASAYTRYELLRYLSMRVRTAASKGETPGAEANVMKLFTAQHAKQLGALALEIEGAGGMLIGADAPDGAAWQQQFLSAPSIRIAGGSDEVQRNVIGERSLGLPGDVRVDKAQPFKDLAKQ
jgi:alkylation response protein AidB-like acyl-CoA dehydrogenase